MRAWCITSRLRPIGCDRSLQHQREIGTRGFRPGGVSGYPQAWYRSVSCVRAPPSACSHKFVGTFSCAHIDLRKARERDLATLNEKSTSSGIAEP